MNSAIRIFVLVPRQLKIVVSMGISESENSMLSSHRRNFPFKSVPAIPFAGEKASIAIIILRVRQHQHSPETVVRHVISSIRTLLNPPDTPVFDLVARVVTECLPVTIIVTSVCGLEVISEMDVSDGEASVRPVHFEILLEFKQIETTQL